MLCQYVTTQTFVILLKSFVFIENTLEKASSRYVYIHLCDHTYEE